MKVLSSEIIGLRRDGTFVTLADLYPDLFRGRRGLQVRPVEALVRDLPPAQPEARCSRAVRRLLG